MTREEAGQLWPIIKDYSDGKEIELSDPRDGEWNLVEEPDFTAGVNSYRVKKEPVYRSFENANECLEEIVKHHPVGWIKSSRGIFNIFEIGDCYIMLAKHGVSRYNTAINDFVFVDGTPFGIKEENI